jgi:hypothetical protein
VLGQTNPLFSEKICTYVLIQPERDVLQEYVSKVWLEEIET